MSVPSLKDLLWQVGPARRGPLSEEESEVRTAKRLTDKEVEDLAAYLEAPTNQGFWRLTGTWKYDGRFSQFAYEQLAAKLFPEDKPVTTGRASATALLAARSLTDEQQTFISQAFSQITSLFEAYTFSLLSRDVSKNQKEIETLKKRSTRQWIYQLNFEAFRERFIAADKIFQEKLYFSEFKPLVSGESPVWIACGMLFVIRGPREGEQLLAASTKQESVEHLGNFLEATGQVDGISLEKVYAPEEELFEPYFSFLSAAYSRLINDERVRPQFRQAFDYYSKRDYVHCTSTLGLVAEDYLTQIYETYLREPCPKGLTLGQVYDLFHNHLRDLTMPPREELHSLDNLYGEIQRLQGIELSNDPKELRDRLLPLVRQLVSSIKLDRKHFSQRIDDFTSHDRRVSVFPLSVRENLSELIRYRNAASHKTRVPLGNYEALRTLFCLTSFLLWWKREKQSTQWGDDKLRLIQAAIAQSSK